MDGPTGGGHMVRAWTPRSSRSARVAILDSGGPTRRAPNPGGGHLEGGTVVKPVVIDRAHYRARRERVDLSPP
ncbi:hypothetical protein IscW_ISCW007944 [Ixodes scapularis]|uniref:Uncharacterized protein n=1 Tax=Ixodes scapularis TaxID=6945 RepID=B7PRP8_IXOSC|nr:hypothetical protein IscW_ISCW007944 [Ixodes scapularis]|eukprot:XP_002400582.1 hypothetical protein IscW_ISCW007944 [Ixodes scapularis]